MTRVVCFAEKCIYNEDAKCKLHRIHMKELVLDSGKSVFYCFEREDRKDVDK